MDPQYEADKIQLRLKSELDVLKLSTGCPYDHCNPSFCPLHSVREMKLDDRINWIHELSDSDLEYLSTYHQVCLHWRSANDAYSPSPN